PGATGGGTVGGTGGTGGAATGGSGGTQSALGAADANGGLASSAGQAGQSAAAIGGGNGSWRLAAPVVYDRPIGFPATTRPLILFAALLLMPLVVFWLRRLR
ncbi:MAG: hypothetical protein M3N98_00505, partial [Actinomycetota bacterium]|nr:hypothetical protein [Actinomycetota bacterium]